MSEHTPGPWCYLYRGEALGWVVDQAGVQHIAAVCANETPDDDEANARLIAAAPDLLAALHRIAFEPYGRADASAHEVLDAIMADARAAIAKAKGETA